DFSLRPSAPFDRFHFAQDRRPGHDVGQQKTAASTRQRRQLPQEGHHVQAQGAVTLPPVRLSLDFGEASTASSGRGLSRAVEAPDVCRLAVRLGSGQASGRQPAPQAISQVRR
ncbi:MAG: hypothetical protein V3T92_01655, partial [Anaerolineae bacterium]